MANVVVVGVVDAELPPPPQPARAPVHKIAVQQNLTSNFRELMELLLVKDCTSGPWSLHFLMGSHVIKFDLSFHVELLKVNSLFYSIQEITSRRKAWQANNGAGFEDSWMSMI